MKKTGFSMIELIIVIVIIAILATLVILNFRKSREKTFNYIAKADLKILVLAERSYYLDVKAYYPASGTSSDIAEINDNLNTGLDSSSIRKWDYSVKSTGCVQATRTGDNYRSWYLPVDTVDFDPIEGLCP